MTVTCWVLGIWSLVSILAGMTIGHLIKRNK